MRAIILFSWTTGSIPWNKKRRKCYKKAGVVMATPARWMKKKGLTNDYFD
jgi:hypothetical protein